MQGIAFITGADRGLGIGLTASLLARGWRVLAGQYLPDWHELPGYKERYPDLLEIVPLDVSSSESVKSAAQIVSQHTDKVDLLINNAGVNSPTNRRSIRENLDFAEMHRLYDVNALGALRVVEAFVPMTDRSEFKRLCFVSSEAGSITKSYRTAWYGYCMSKSALNMAISILFNQLRPESYTFRVYHPGWVRSYMGGKKNINADMEPEEAAEKAIPIFLGSRENEDKLVLVDYQGQEWPW
jgi:NAD(P)-dependent dehydrogenase (short-subunit alcohol dehydrogenase family)